MKTTKILSGLVAAACLSLPATAQMAPMAWDMDGDQLVAQDEFEAGLTSSGTFGSYDSDADGLLSEDEWNAGFGDAAELWGERDYEIGAFGDLDGDADGLLSEQEYNTGWFDTYDSDRSGDIDETERLDIERDMAPDGLFGRVETDA